MTGLIPDCDRKDAHAQEEHHNVEIDDGIDTGLRRNNHPLKHLDRAKWKSMTGLIPDCDVKVPRVVLVRMAAWKSMTGLIPDCDINAAHSFQDLEISWKSMTGLIPDYFDLRFTILDFRMNFRIDYHIRKSTFVNLKSK